MTVNHTSTQANSLEGAKSRLVSYKDRTIDFIDRWIHFFFPAPTVLILAALFVVPIIYTVYLSFHRWGLSAIRPPQPVGLGNFIALLNAQRFSGAIVHSFYFSFLAVTIQTILGIGIALIFNRRFVGRGIARTLFLFPMMATPIASMIGWSLILDPNVGVLSLFYQLGLPPIELLSNERLVIPVLVMVDTWRWTPFMTIIILAGLSALPSDPYEAALMDGASSWQLFRYITMPLLRPVLVMAMLFRTIDSLKVFEPVFVLTRGGPRFQSETLNLYAYLESFEYFHLGYASALMVVYFFIILFFSLILIRVRRVEWQV